MNSIGTTKKQDRNSISDAVISLEKGTKLKKLCGPEISVLLHIGYRIALLVMLNAYDATSDPLTFMLLPKSQPNQTSHSTGPPPLSYAELHERCDQSLWTAD